MKAQTRDSSGGRQLGCNVNSAFNFTVGAIATVVGLLIAYWVFVHR